ncbi:MAG: WecB/TagA/CpsF family glycosyltransferase [Clostridiales bacterium]|nr:WecB/TagA/CpsF family glycosyltransferase [Clostridiales bacterium]
MKRVEIIKVPISAVNMETCLSSIFGDFESLRGQYICVSNVHTTVMAHDDPDYFRVQSESFMSVPDGKPLSVIGRKKAPGMDRVTGPDLMREIFMRSKDTPFRHYFYGNTRENLDALIAQLKTDYPWLVIAGSEESVFRDMTPEEEDALAERINETSPDFVWVALGAPRQELFCHRMTGKINGLMIGVGGAFNILSGVVRDAPVWMKKCGMEWLFRLMMEPRRLFKRYAVTNTKFIWYYLTGR